MRDFGDAPAGTAAPAGSLRGILGAAQPGDVIRFERAAVVQLDRAIQIPTRLRGIVIDGAVGGARAEIRSRTEFALNVSAGGAVIRNLVVSGATLGVTPATPHGEVVGVQVRGSRFAGTNARLATTSSDNTVVEGNAFEDATLDVDLTGGIVIRDNDFRGPSRAIDGSGVSRALISGNRITGTGIRVQMNRRSRIFDNDIEGADPLAVQGSGSVDFNRVTVAGGEARLIATDRLGARGNTFGGRGTVTLGCTTGGDPPALDFIRNTLTGVGAGIGCDREASYALHDNTITGARGGVAVGAPRSRVTIDGGAITGNSVAGIRAFGARMVRVRGVRIQGNQGAGIHAAPGATVQIGGVRMGANSGPGIDTGSPRPPALTYDRRRKRIKGRTCALCTVELYASEPEPQQIGNPGRGEGTHAIGRVRAGADGRFVFPRRGSLDCPETGRVTAIATRPGGRSSAFAKDMECACVFTWEFDVDPREVPRTGFANRGASVSFPAGSTIGDVELADVATDERPRDDAFLPQIQWSEMQKERPGLPPDRVGRDFFVQLTWRDRGAPEPTQAAQRWVYRIAYTPPKDAKGCGAKNAP